MSAPGASPGHEKLLGRRRLLRDAGVAAAAGTAVAVVGESSAAAAPTAVTAINVRDARYGAAGDGNTDDRDAIQRALDDAGDSGGAVFLPPGDYLVSGPLAPRSHTLIHGTHVPRWDKPVNPTSSCKIRMGGNFRGDGLVVPAATTVAVTLRNLALIGDHVGSGLHGLRMPDDEVAAGELSWVLEDTSIVGFTGDGIHGRMHVGLLDNCFVHNNAHWGVNASGGNSWNDMHVSNCYFFYNTDGNVYFGGPAESAAVDFVNCRFERAGTNPDDVLRPLKKDSPGIRLASARLMQLVNCNTDANTGNGIEIVREADTPDHRPDNILLANCRLNRDGTGDQSALGAFAGLKVRGLGAAEGATVNDVKAVNCMVTSGEASDSGEGTVVGPRYGVWYENTAFFQWIGGNLSPSPQADENGFFSGEGNNFRPTLIDPKQGLLTVPVDEPDAGAARPAGAMYLAGTELRVWDGTRWLGVALD